LGGSPPVDDDEVLADLFRQQALQGRLHIPAVKLISVA